MFQAIYESPWHNPALLWLCALLFLAALVRRLPFLVGFCIAFAVVVLADTLATGGWSPLVAAKSSWLTPVAVLFVILGDFRFFLLMERTVAGKVTRAALGLAIAMSLLVPVASYLSQRLWPAYFEESRITFLTYEAMFVLFAVVLRVWVYPRRLAGLDPPLKRWLIGITHFEILQYTLWATADIIILVGSTWGYLLRLVPNLMYYALFLPFVWWTRPKEE